MTTQSLQRDYSPVPTARRRLAHNVIALHAEDYPPVVQATRRGRFPANVVRINSVPRLYVGCLCELRTTNNEGVPVRVVQIDDENNIGIESIGTKKIRCNDGLMSNHAVTYARLLHRTVMGERHV